jgi:hypothetical protein
MVLNHPQGPKVARMSVRLGRGASGAIRRFAGWVARGSVGSPMLEGINSWNELRDFPSQMEICFAIFVNVLELDERGNPLNESTPTARRDVPLPVLHREASFRRGGLVSRGSSGAAHTAICGILAARSATPKWPPVGYATSPATRSRSTPPARLPPTRSTRRRSKPCARSVSTSPTKLRPSSPGSRRSLRRHRHHGLRRRLPRRLRQTLRRLETRRPRRPRRRRRQTDPRRHRTTRPCPARRLSNSNADRLIQMTVAPVWGKGFQTGANVDAAMHRGVSKGRVRLRVGPGTADATCRPAATR